VFAVWQPRARIGAERVNDVGCLGMNELATTDLDAARSFYEGLFGWTTEPIDTGPGGPSMASALNAGTLNATLGVVQGDAPPHWRPYFTVESITHAVERIRELGGRIVVEPFEVPAGQFAMAFDPQGAFFAFFEGEIDP
jgi:predicted enzyme related to lactoylglutathione lyase